MNPTTLDNLPLIKARVLDRLIDHLDQHKEVQNIDLMILAKFCRNCLSKWMVAEAEALGETLGIEDARRSVYKMDYAEWKAKHQTEATPEQLAQFQQSQK
ncbi:DUF1244 domain-containing protein [Marinicella meishanensis]|uniref:DUF1244 domain-containing protein n=1 Tax=Marinicella meishanensis TaxID=2873263 RepID=UPI001CC085F2|nr:DUF1244 domain-containing protein [Marinicella sp. NBU2979]